MALATTVFKTNLKADLKAAIDYSDTATEGYRNALRDSLYNALLATVSGTPTQASKDNLLNECQIIANGVVDSFRDTTNGWISALVNNLGTRMEEWIKTGLVSTTVNTVVTGTLTPPSAVAGTGVGTGSGAIS